MDIKHTLQARSLTPNPLKDQFFLINPVVIERMVSLADIRSTDTVLEIGVGTGVLTEALARKASKVIAFEVDLRFKPLLDHLPKNVELRFEDAHAFIELRGKFPKKREFNKIVANLPYSLCEYILHNLTFLECDKVLLLVPKKFARSSKTNPVFSSFFHIEERMEVSRRDFYPSPRTDSVIIELLRLPEPLKHKHLSLFLRQYLYRHEDQKTKNALVEGLVTYAKEALERKVSKNEARDMLERSTIRTTLLETNARNAEIYREVEAKLSNDIFMHSR